MKNWVYLLIEFFLIISSVLIAGYLGVYFGIELSKQETINFNYENCSNLSLYETSYCLREKLREVYNYSVMPDINRSMEDIITFGGDCYDYSRLYLNWSEELGFKAQKISIYPKSNKSGHAFIIIHDETGYCKLDQISEPNCFLFKKLNESNSTE
jgi:hypothetical protein